MKIARSETLPVLPMAVLNLLRLFAQENVSSRELANVIGEDAGLGIKVMKVANSPQFGTGQCENIIRAINVIGVNRMKQIAVTLGYEQFTLEKSQAPEFKKKTFMEHCKVTATVAREIMVLINRSKQDNAYMIGLIHDVGFLAMDKHSPHELNQSILAARVRHLSIVEGANQICGYNHQMVSEKLAQSWKLAPYIRDAIKYLGSPESSEIDVEMSMVLAAAKAIACEMGFPPITGLEIEFSSEQFFSKIDLTNEQMVDVVERAKIEFSLTEDPNTKKAA
ncbi:MAG: HDOD domain-containing protein [Armatimonadota bacterium]